MAANALGTICIAAYDFGHLFYSALRDLTVSQVYVFVAIVVVAIIWSRYATDKTALERQKLLEIESRRLKIESQNLEIKKEQLSLERDHEQRRLKIESLTLEVEKERLSLQRDHEQGRLKIEQGRLKVESLEWEIEKEKLSLKRDRVAALQNIATATDTGVESSNHDQRGWLYSEGHSQHRELSKARFSPSQIEHIRRQLYYDEDRRRPIENNFDDVRRSEFHIRSSGWYHSDALEFTLTLLLHTVRGETEDHRGSGDSGVFEELKKKKGFSKDQYHKMDNILTSILSSDTTHMWLIGAALIIAIVCWIVDILNIRQVIPMIIIVIFVRAILESQRLKLEGQKLEVEKERLSLERDLESRRLQMARMDAEVEKERLSLERDLEGRRLDMARLDAEVENKRISLQRDVIGQRLEVETSGCY
ncbi:hypothetical protein Bbelb_004070 [Branchiostoma belcheri]|nr:hypothetical protein Bbelb_004070 [Branchiostoma belcheri]